MAHLNLSVLGEFAVSSGPATVQAFESDKVRALLAYLVVCSDQPHRRERLIGLLWPDCPEETARHNLRQALFNLRLVLGDHTARPPYLLISREAIQFNRGSDYSLDVDQFNHLFEGWERDRRKEGSDSAPTLLRLEAMVKLYRGEFLQHFSLRDSAEFEDWILVQREALRQCILEVLTCLANEYERQGDFQGARAQISRLLELDPWREEAHYQMMRVLAGDGQRSAAIAQYETCRRVLAEELGVEPSAKTRDLYEQIRAGGLQKRELIRSDISTLTPGLPASLTPFFGRVEELADLAQLIADPQCRCITLVGAGGIGKTRLALQAAAQHRHSFAQGAAFVSLAGVSSVEAAIPAIASGTGFLFYGRVDPRTQILRHLHNQQLLLILDNLEHLLVEDSPDEGIRALVIQILQEAPQVKLLVTSREPMDIQGEWLYEVRGLPFPDAVSFHSQVIEGFDSVALFLQRARQVRRDFGLNQHNQVGIARLCSLVEGMPLAIELAATWVRLLNPVEIATEIERSLDFLKTQTHDMPKRHRSVRAVFDRSWQTLSAEERHVLAKLSVFCGGFERQAAEEVAGASLQVLSSLVVRSLLRRTPTGRYDLHELIRQYAASKLEEDSDELQSAKDRHSSYYLGLLEARAGALRSNRQKDVLAELTKDIENFRAAWNRSVDQHRFDVANRVSTVLWYIYELHNWWKEGEDKFGNTAAAIQVYMDSAGSKDEFELCVLHAMLSHAAYFKFRLGRSVEAYGILASNALALPTSVDPRSAVYPLCYLGIVCWEQGKFEEARQSLRQSVQFAQVFRERWCEGIANEFLGIVEHEQGNYEQARECLEQSLSIARQLGDPLLISHVLSYLGRTMRVLGEHDKAEKQLRESIEVARGIDYRSGVGLGLDALALLLDAEGRHEEARSVFLESASLFREVGDTYRHSRVLIHQGMNFMASNEVAEAREAFLTALRMSYERGYEPSSLEALVGLAALATKKKADRQTLELIVYVHEHPASTREAKDLAATLQAEQESELSGEEVEAARQQASSRNLEEFVRRALAGVSQ